MISENELLRLRNEVFTKQEEFKQRYLGCKRNVIKETKELEKKEGLKLSRLGYQRNTAIQNAKLMGRNPESTVKLYDRKEQEINDEYEQMKCNVMLPLLDVEQRRSNLMKENYETLDNESYEVLVGCNMWDNMTVMFLDFYDEIAKLGETVHSYAKDNIDIKSCITKVYSLVFGVPNIGLLHFTILNGISKMRHNNQFLDYVASQENDIDVDFESLMTQSIVDFHESMVNYVNKDPYQFDFVKEKEFIKKIMIRFAVSLRDLLIKLQPIKVLIKTGIDIENDNDYPELMTETGDLLSNLLDVDDDSGLDADIESLLK